MRFTMNDEYDAGHPRIDEGDGTYDLVVGPFVIGFSLDDLKHLQTEVGAALMEAQRAEGGYRGMLDDEKPVAQDFEGAPF